MVVGGCLGLSDSEKIEFSVWGEVKREVSKTTTMGFQRAGFGLFRTLAERIPWERVLKGKGVQEAGHSSRRKSYRHRNSLSPCATRRTSEEDDRPGWRGSSCWDSGKKRRAYLLWKKGQATQEKYRGLIRLCREEISKAKAQLEPRLATVVRDNKKCFYKYINHKKKTKDSLHPLLDGRGNIANKDEEKAEVVHAFFASVFNSQTRYSQGS